MTLEERLMSLIDERELTVRHVADAIGVTEVTMSRLIHNANTRLNVFNWVKLAKFFDMTVEQLIEGCVPEE